MEAEGPNGGGEGGEVGRRQEEREKEDQEQLHELEVEVDEIRPTSRGFPVRFVVNMLKTLNYWWKGN